MLNYIILIIIIIILIIILYNINNSNINNSKIKFIKALEQLDETNPYNKALYYGYQMINKFNTAVNASRENGQMVSPFSEAKTFATKATYFATNARDVDTAFYSVWDAAIKAALTAESAANINVNNGAAETAWKLIIQAYFKSNGYNVTVDTDDINILTDPKELVNNITFN